VSRALAPRWGLSWRRIFSGLQREGNEEEVIRLLDADPGLLERADQHGDSPLIGAAAYGQLGVARLLIARGASINATGHEGSTALHYAVPHGHEEVLALLLRKGAHANTRDQYGMTPLMRACDNGYLGMVKMLVQYLGDQGLNERDNLSGWTALHRAADGGHNELTRFLLLAGADPTITDHEGRTPRALAEANHYMSRIRSRRARCLAVFRVRPLTY
jgi:ankyrin repeat protein